MDEIAKMMKSIQGIQVSKKTFFQISKKHDFSKKT